MIVHFSTKDTVFTPGRTVTGAHHTMEEPGKGSKEWTPIKVDLLPARPQIVGKLDPGSLERWVTLERLTEQFNATSKFTLDHGLDLSTHTDLETVAARIGRFLIEDYDEETKVAYEAAKAMEVNESAVLGVVEVGHTTPAHTHMNGVISWCGAGGCKLWSFKNKMQDGIGDDDVVLLQEDGDLLWVPPGWSHEVRTLQGSRSHNTELCMHWVTWCTPFAFFERAVLAFACGVISESQMQRLRRRPTLECTRGLHALVHKMEARRRARSFEGRHIRVGSEYQAEIPEYQGDLNEQESRHTSPSRGKRKTIDPG